MPQFKNKRTGALWEIEKGSPAYKRIMANPDDYEEVQPPKKKKVSE